MGFLWNVVRFLGSGVAFAGEGEEGSGGNAGDTGNKNGSLLENNGGKTNLTDARDTLMNTFKDIMSIVMPIVLSVVLALGVFFCIKLGIAYAKAEKTEDREEAKKRLVGAIIGFGIGIVGAAVMWILFTNDSILSNLFGTTA